MKKNKDTPNPNGERASAQGIKASVTIEAAMAIPLFLLAVLFLIYTMEMKLLETVICSAAYCSAKEITEDTAIVPILNHTKLKAGIVSQIGEQRLERSILKGGADSISCWRSCLIPGTGQMDIVVEYKVKLPILFLADKSVTKKESFKMSAWNGFCENEDPDGADAIVYVTQYSLVYHERPDCTYLSPSIRFIPFSSLDGVRNKGGGKYRRCEKCVHADSMSGVYVTDYGDKYHNSLTCPGLKRTIRAVKKSEIHGMGGCSKCSE